MVVASVILPLLGHILVISWDLVHWWFLLLLSDLSALFLYSRLNWYHSVACFVSCIFQMLYKSLTCLFIVSGPGSIFSLDRTILCSRYFKSSGSLPKWIVSALSLVRLERCSVTFWLIFSSIRRFNFWLALFKFVLSAGKLFFCCFRFNFFW